MMQIEHINLVVSDLTKSLIFYQAAFPHWRIRGKGSMQWFGQQRTWLHFGDDYFYLTLNDKGVGKNRDLTGHSIGLAHCGFITHNLEKLIERLKIAGFKADKVGQAENHRKNAYYIDPDGFEIEFVEYLSDDPAERNRYAD